MRTAIYNLLIARDHARGAVGDYEDLVTLPSEKDALAQLRDDASQTMTDILATLAMHADEDRHDAARVGNADLADETLSHQDQLALLHSEFERMDETRHSIRGQLERRFTEAPATDGWESRIDEVIDDAEEQMRTQVKPSGPRRMSDDGEPSEAP